MLEKNTCYAMRKDMFKFVILGFVVFFVSSCQSVKPEEVNLAASKRNGIYLAYVDKFSNYHCLYFPKSSPILRILQKYDKIETDEEAEGVLSPQDAFFIVENGKVVDGFSVMFRERAIDYKSSIAGRICDEADVITLMDEIEKGESVKDEAVEHLKEPFMEYIVDFGNIKPQK